MTSRPFQRYEEKRWTFRGGDPEVAGRAAEALSNLLEDEPNSASRTGLPPEPVAAAVLGAMRRHPQEEFVQWWGCNAIAWLCYRFPALPATLQPDPSVFATVRAAAEVWGLEEEDWYTQELCRWLQPCLVGGMLVDGSDLRRSW